MQKTVFNEKTKDDRHCGEDAACCAKPGLPLKTGNPFGSMHYNSLAVLLKRQFGSRVVKLALDGGFTCPNRDGTKGTGGCIYCSSRGSGDFAVSAPGLGRSNGFAAAEASAGAGVCVGAGAAGFTDIEQQAAALARKWPGMDSAPRFIAYFQNNTGTYAPVPYLRRLWDQALSLDNVVGLAVATRPDCLSDDILDLLSEYNRKTFLWIELGLQTASDETARLINRCYPTSVFEDAMRKLKERGIRTVVHLILGLPGEDRHQMLASASYVASFEPFGIKLHMLHVLEGTRLGDIYRSQTVSDDMRGFRNGAQRIPKGAQMIRDDFPKIRLLNFEEYVKLAVDILEIMPPSVSVHRLTGDAPQEVLLAPDWTRNKHAVLNAIQHEFSVRGSWQGIRAST